ncbi:MAG: arylsulfotransferase family protein [Myxococcota bacterium]|nr:arylsulfotransferase family protein [Myxococcota bacterium]
MRSESELIEELSAIGYLAGSAAAGPTQGVVLHDAARSAPGFNLITSGHGPVAVLMRMDGTVVHEWTVPFDRVFPDHPRSKRSREARRNFWRDVILFPNGDLVVIWELFGIFKLDRDSNILWAVPEPAHHDLQLTGTGEIVHLQAERKMIPGIPDRPAIEDFIITRDGEGRELRRVALSRALENVNWLKLRRKFWQRAGERDYGLSENSAYDPFHTNSLRLLSQADASKLGRLFKAGDALVSMGTLDTVAILDLEEGVTRWSQQGPFGMQHSARLSPRGEILLFNNFVTPTLSSAMALDPRTREVTWEFRGVDSRPLHSRRSGGVQLLGNGNVLIAETDGGRGLEVTREGEVVWEFHSPYRVGEAEEKVAHLYSLKRIEEGFPLWLQSEEGPHSKE